MNSRNVFASILMACLLAVDFLGIAPAANAASAGQSILKRGEITTNNVIEIKRRGHGPRYRLPIGPAYRYYDYPYYHARGYYPTYIGPGMMYYGQPYSYYRRGYGD